MAYIDFLTEIHSATKRDYIGRVNEFPKAEASRVAKQYGFDYWDGERHFGYGGYKYIEGYWARVAKPLIDHYGLKDGDSVLDVGCGKAFLLYEMKRILPGLEISGLDISQYGINHAKKDIKPFLTVGNAIDLPYNDNQFDLVFSINTLHNLYIYDLEKAIQEIERVGVRNKYIVVESYRNLEEKTNLLYWVLTGECYFTPREWEWFYDRCNYTGDHSFIYFE